MTAGQRWSREVPKVPGWYWFRPLGKQGAAHGKTEVFKHNGILIVPLRDVEWQGPITPHDQEAG